MPFHPAAVAFSRPYRFPLPRPPGLFSSALPIAPLSRQIPRRRRRQPPAVRPPPYHCRRRRRHRINSLPPDGPGLESASRLRRINIYLACCPMSPVNAPPSVIVKCRRHRRRASFQAGGLLKPRAAGGKTSAPVRFWFWPLFIDWRR